MHVEDLFRLIDRVLGLDRTPNLVVLLMFTFLTFLLSIVSLYKLHSIKQSNAIEPGTKRVGSPILTLTIYALIILLMAIGMGYSIYKYSIDLLLVLSFIMYIGFLTLTLIFSGVLFKSQRKFVFLLLFFTSSLLYAFFFSSKVLLNGIEASETATDTLQIYYNGHWRFSRHASWYDLAPVDAIVKVFLLHIFGINNPYEPVITTLMYSALAFSMLIFVLAFVRRLYSNTIVAWSLSILLLSINPYVPLIDMSTPPTNFSLVLSMFAIILISMDLITKYATTTSIAIAFVIFTASAILAHPMSIMIPVYLLAIYISMISSNKKSSKYLHNLVVISTAIFLIKFVFTGVSLGAKILVDAIIKGLMAFLLAEEPIDIKMYMGGPTPPKSTLFSFAAFLGLAGAIFFVEFVKLLRGYGSKTTVMILGAGFLLTLAGVLSNFYHPSSRYLAYPGITLCSFQSIIYLNDLFKTSVRSKWRSLLIILIGIMCLATTLSPNAMLEQYNIFTGGRWPRIENFILSSYLIDHVDLGYVIKVFNWLDRARLHIYFTPDILYYGHPYHHIEVLITEKFLIPELINARSYWDFYGGRLFVRYAGYIDPVEIAEGSTIFSGWKWVMVWE